MNVWVDGPGRGRQQGPEEEGAQEGAQKEMMMKTFGEESSVNSMKRMPTKYVLKHDDVRHMTNSFLHVIVKSEEGLYFEGPYLFLFPPEKKRYVHGVVPSSTT